MTMQKSPSRFFLLLLVLLSFPALAFADGFELEILEINPVSDGADIQDSYKADFPYSAGMRNNRGEKFLDTYQSTFVTSDGRKIFSDCLLRNSERWEPSAIIGLNDKGDILLHLTHRDTADAAIGILHSTGAAIESYCPVATWDINKSCRDVLLYGGLFVDGNDPGVRYDRSGNLIFPVTSNRNLGSDNRGGEGPYLTRLARKNPYCTFRLRLRTPDGKPFSRQSFLIFGRGRGKNDKVLAATRTDKNGSAKLTINLQSFVEKNFPGPCEGVVVRAQTPFLNDKWISRGINLYIWDHCE